jgi:hypothetical protein
VLESLVASPILRPRLTQGGFTKGERKSSLLCIWPLYMHGSFPAISGASGVKNWHSPRTDREKGSEQERGRENEWGDRKPV